MSRARELAKLGGAGQQVVAGLSSFVGISTFASDVFMLDDLTVSGNLNVTGDLTYDEVSARNQNVTGITTTVDLIVSRNASVTGILTASKGLTGNINATGVSTAAFLQATNINTSGIETATRFVSTVATGTAPLTVSSTTAVTNLNADLLDGQHAPSGTIVGTSDTQTLTNKTLTTPVISSISNSGTITIPSSTDTLVGRATTDTLTNKTIAAGSNTITGLTNSNLSGTAGITNANLANSTISGVALGSNLNALTISTGLSGSSYNGSGAVTIAIDSTVCTLTGTQTLTNKTIGAATISGNIAPNANNTINLGSSANRWANVYSNDLDLSNEGSANSIDGTWGSYLVQEGEEHLYIINRRSGKKFRFVLEEV